MFVTGDDLVGSSTDLGVLVPVELLQCLIDPVLKSLGAAIADDVQDPGPDPDILIINQFKHSFPEDFNVPEHLAWTKLFDGFESNIVVLLIGVFEDDFNIGGVPAFVDDVLLMDVNLVVVLLPVVPSFRHCSMYYTIHSVNLKLKRERLIL